MKTVVAAKLRVVLVFLALIALFDLFTVWAIASSLHFIIEYLTTLQGATLHKQIVLYYSVGLIGVAGIVYTAINAVARLYATAKFTVKMLTKGLGEEN
jgi:hypothetical protein